MTLPSELQKFGEPTVLAALQCFEGTGTLEFAGDEAELVEELIRSSLVRASVQSRFLTSEGEIRLRVQSQGLSVAGAWMKRLLDGSAGR